MTVPGRREREREVVREEEGAKNPVRSEERGEEEVRRRKKRVEII